MNKIICDICGTTYPSSTESCPICGCSNAAAADILNAEGIQDDFQEETTAKVVNTRKKEIFDFDEVNTDEYSEEEEEEATYDDEEEEEEAPCHNTFVVILLTVLIVVLLGAAAFIYFRYFMPSKQNEVPVASTEAVLETELTEQTTEPTIPCEQMAMTNAGVAELNAEGQQFLLHIKALPENTTDKIVYTSADERIATVTEDGKITAVSEGETVIYISCGKTSMECPVIVKYVEETVPPTTVAVVDETTTDVVPEGTESAEETIPEETADAADPEDNVENTEEDTESSDNAGLKDVQLKLKKSDIQLGVYYQFLLELDCDLDPEEVTWSSEHPHIAKVDETGNVTAVKEGTTAIIAKYGDQEVQCIVRCIWY